WCPCRNDAAPEFAGPRRNGTKLRLSRFVCCDVGTNPLGDEITIVVQTMPWRRNVQATPEQRPDSALRLVITLMFVNLGISVLTTIITLILHNSVIDYQLAHTHVPSADLGVTRHALQTTLW